MQVQLVHSALCPQSPTQPVHQKDLWAKFDLEVTLSLCLCTLAAQNVAPKVTHIDTAQQTFSVDGWLNMWWKEESLDDKLPADKRRTVYKWNMYGDSENNRADALIRDDDGTCLFRLGEQGKVGVDR